MTVQNKDRNLIKQIVEELLVEKPSLLQPIVKEVIQGLIQEAKDETVQEESEEDRKRRIEALIDEDFKKYDKVFKALA